MSQGKFREGLSSAATRLPSVKVRFSANRPIGPTRGECLACCAARNTASIVVCACGESRTKSARLQIAETKLVMDPIGDADLEQYLDSGQWQGKAGAFGYQDGLEWVHIIEGSESNVVGLPMEMLNEMLANLNSPE